MTDRGEVDIFFRQTEIIDECGSNTSNEVGNFVYLVVAQNISRLQLSAFGGLGPISPHQMIAG